MFTFIRNTSFIILICLIFDNLTAQSVNSSFGQNRVQYHTFEWSFYESEHFNTYYYIGGQDLGKFIILDAEQEYKELSGIIDFRLRNKIDIMVYTDITDANMSNIGVKLEDRNPGGTVKVLDNKIFLWFDGSHEQLRGKLREGLMQVYIGQMAQGNSFQEVMQNVVMSSLPQWYTQGLANYLAYGWTTADDDRLRSGILSSRFRKFKRLEAEDQVFLGKAFWNYIQIQFGKSTSNNLIYLTRVHRTLESAFLFAIGTSVNESISNCLNFYKDRYGKQILNLPFPSDSLLIPIKTKKNIDYYNVNINSNGNKLVYATNDVGRQKLKLYDLNSKKSKTLLRMGFRTRQYLTDKSYPLVDWQPDDKKIAAIFEKRDKIKLLLYDIETEKKEIKPITKFQKVFGMSYGTDNNTLLLSAMQRAQCDLFSYQIKSTTTKQLTNDIWDDLNPTFVSAGEHAGIVFLSNRPSDTLKVEKLDKRLPLGSYNLFLYSPSYSQNMLSQITFGENKNFGEVENFNSQYFMFTSDEQGIRGRNIARFEENFWYMATTYFYTDTINQISDSITLQSNFPVDSVLDLSSVVITDSRTFPVNKLVGKTFRFPVSASSIYEQSFAASKNMVVEMMFDGWKYKMYKQTLDTSWNEFSFPKLQAVSSNIIQSKQEQSKRKADAYQPIKIQTENKQPEIVYFQSDFDVEPSIDNDSTRSGIDLSIKTYKPIVKLGTGFKFSKIQPYQVVMQADKFSAQLDNSLLLTRYAPFNPANPSFQSPSLGGLFKLGIKDIMEDYRLYGGYKIPTTVSGSEYLLCFENNKKRLDHKLTYYRLSRPVSSNEEEVPFDTAIISPQNLPLEYNIKSNYFEWQLKYAFDPVQAIRFGVAYRNDKYVYRASNYESLNLLPYTTNWVLLRAEYIFDNTYELATNLRRGFRCRVFAEVHKELPTQSTRITDDFFVKLPRWNNAWLGVVGADLRYYHKVYKNIVFATRFSWSTSFGNRKMIYYLGGVDGAILPRFNTTTPINSDYNYAYQSLAADLRGFDQNIRNGNSYACVNAELRIPVFSTLINTPIRSEFIRNFQLVGFTDFGTAWEGLNPYDNSNPLFEEVIRDPENSPVSVKVIQKKSPIVAGYGFGFRTSLFGYFFRTDFAWGYDGARTTRAKVHFSFNIDF